MPQGVHMISRPFPMKQAKGKQSPKQSRQKEALAPLHFSSLSSLASSESDTPSHSYQSPVSAALHLHLGKQEQTRASTLVFSFDRLAQQASQIILHGTPGSSSSLPAVGGGPSSSPRLSAIGKAKLAALYEKKKARQAERQKQILDKCL